MNIRNPFNKYIMKIAVVNRANQPGLRKSKCDSMLLIVKIRIYDTDLLSKFIARYFLLGLVLMIEHNQFPPIG